MSDKLKHSLKSLLKGGGLLIAGQFLTMGLWFGIRIIVVRTTTKEELGLYSLAFALAGIGSLIASMGIPDGITRYVSVFNGEGRAQDARAVGRTAMHIVYASSLVASLVLLVFAEPISRHVFYIPGLVIPLRAVAFVTFFHATSGIASAIAKGYGNIRVTVYKEASIPLLFLIFLIASYSLGFPFISILFSYLLALAGSFAITLLATRRGVDFNPFSLKPGRHMKALMRFSLPLIGVTFAILIFSWTDTLMLGRYAGAESVGVYNVSLSIVRLLHFIVGALESMLLPIAGALYSKGHIEEMKRIYQVITRWGFIVTMPLFLIFFFFPEMTIWFIFGSKHIDSAPVLTILSVGYMAKVFLGANFAMLMVLGRTKPIFYITIIGSLLNIVLNYVFIKLMGAGPTGAAYATAISNITIVAAAAVVLYRSSGIQPVTRKYFMPALYTALICLAFYAMVKVLFFSLWILPLYLIGFVTACLMVIPLSRSIEYEDIMLFEGISRRAGMRMEFIRKIISKYYSGPMPPPSGS